MIRCMHAVGDLSKTSSGVGRGIWHLQSTMERAADWRTSQDQNRDGSNPFQSLLGLRLGKMFLYWEVLCDKEVVPLSVMFGLKRDVLSFGIIFFLRRFAKRK